MKFAIHLYVFLCLVMPPPTDWNVTALSSTDIFINWETLDFVVKINGSDYPVAGYTVFVKRYSTTKWQRYATNVSFFPQL